MRRVNSFLLTACTEEKYIRAHKGEVPHVILHVLFVFFFGGSAFIFVGIVVSIAKITAIPICKTILPDLVSKFGSHKMLSLLMNLC